MSESIPSQKHLNPNKCFAVTIPQCPCWASVTIFERDVSGINKRYFRKIIPSFIVSFVPNFLYLSMCS